MVCPFSNVGWGRVTSSRSSFLGPSSIRINPSTALSKLGSPLNRTSSSSANRENPVSSNSLPWTAYSPVNWPGNILHSSHFVIKVPFLPLTLRSSFFIFSPSFSTWSTYVLYIVGRQTTVLPMNVFAHATSPLISKALASGCEILQNSTFPHDNC